MNRAAQRLSPADRDRAVRRLRTMTIGTTMAALAAVGGFGSLAALSYRGSASTDVVTAAVTTSDSSTSTSSDSAATATQTPSATAAPTVSSTSGAAHASTGGS